MMASGEGSCEYNGEGVHVSRVSECVSWACGMGLMRAVLTVEATELVEMVVGVAWSVLEAVSLEVEEERAGLVVEKTEKHSLVVWEEVWEAATVEVERMGLEHSCLRTHREVPKAPCCPLGRWASPSRSGRGSDRHRWRLHCGRPAASSAAWAR